MRAQSQLVQGLEASNLASVLATVRDPTTVTDGVACLAMLADMLDDILAQKVTHINFGMNRKRDSLLVTINHAGGTQTYVAGTDVRELVYKVVTEVSDPRLATLYTAG